MRDSRRPSLARWTAGALGAAVAGYACCVGFMWLRYGRPRPPRAEEVDPVLDSFMPQYDVAERHQVRVAAPAALTFATACEQDLLTLPVVRAIFRARELALGAHPADAEAPRGLLAATRALGWGTLAELPDREVVMGAVTQPWQADVVFRALPPEDFRRFGEPGYVKIAWTLRADPAGPHSSVFRTETRAVSTDAAAREKFRWYWARFSPGIILIRWLSLGPVRREAERRAQTAGAVPSADRPLG